ncbi:trypsin-like peptidase domain-containing protein [Streptomyces coeruleorubidus]|uniref:nSTAND1 domain-containing NTPase n=1 Tax=Streptomyces coeruleorubidus TaxID=116188 RepID=UPI00237F3504|nr:trypsin-like peptidase domain-containing protein [Streptomyces coeruleorubidus]WDV51972.1 trypsin-like peptidase domain-containing protein [Streptomyces coeruleorubidus]
MTESTTSDPVAEDVLAAATVQVTGTDGHIGGLGVLIAPTLVLTCAHVVLDALGLPGRSEAPPEGPVRVTLVLQEGEQTEAVVRDWVPVRANGTGDVAVLSLADPLPEARPVVMVAPRDVWDHKAIVFGLPRDDTGGGWHTARLRARTSTGRLQMSPLDGQSDPIQPGFSGSAVWDDDLGAVVGIVASISPAHRGQAFCIPTRTILDELPELAELLAPSSPFPGLRPYTEEHSAHFFGRDEDVTAVVDLLCPHGSPPEGCVTLTGPSGSGKSSLLMAGVLPRLKEQEVEVVTLRAEGRQPDAATVRDALRTHRSARGLVLAVDQAEALLLRPDDELRALVEGLLDACRHPGVAVLVALRTDFQDAALRHPELSRLVGGAPAHQLGLMTREQLTEVVRLPLRAFPGVEYDSGLADRLIEDAAGRPGALPLLGFALTTLWERQVGGRLRLDTYRELGGLGGVLSSRADSAWRRALRGAARDAATGLLRALIQVPPGSGTALRARLARRDAGEERWSIARELVEARVLVVGADPERGETVELAHEALIEHWQPLAEQLENDRTFLTWRGELRYDRARWWRAGRPDGLLLEDPALSVAERWLADRPDELTEEDREFIEAGVGLRARKAHEAARSERRKQYLRVLWAVVTVLAVVAAAVVSVLYLNLLTEQRRLASDRLAQQAASFDGTSLAVSSLYTVGAYRAEARPDARSALLAQYLRLQDVERVVMENRHDVEDIALTDDGSYAYAVLSNGAFVRLNLRGQKPPKPYYFSTQLDTERIAVSADGRRTARASGWGLISLGVPISSDSDKFRTIALRKGEAMEKNPRAPNDLRFDGDRKRILAAIPREGVLVWNADDGRRTGRTLAPPSGWDAAQAWFAADDTVLARIVPSGAEADDVRGRLVTWDLNRGSLHRPWDDRATASATVSGNGRVLVTCTEQGSLEAWRLGTTPRRFQSWSNDSFQGLCPLYAPRLDATGRYLVNPTGRIGSDLGRMRFLVIDLEKGWPSTFDTPAAPPEDQNITGRSFAPAVALAGPPDDLRAAVSAGGSIVTVRLKPPTSFDSNSLVHRIRTPDGPSGKMAVVDTSGSGLQLWDLAGHRLLATARSSRPLAPMYAAFSPDGRRMLTIAEDQRTVLVWRIDNGSLREEHVLELPAPPGITASGADPQTGLVPSWINLSFSDDDHAVISGLSYVSRWNLDTGKPDGEIYRPPVQERAQLANEAAGTFATAIPGKPQALVRTVAEIGTWDFTTGEFKRWIKRDEDERSVRSFALSPDGEVLAVQYAGGQVRLWDVEKKRDLPALTYNGVYYLGRFLGDRLLHTTTAAGEQVVWDIENRQDTYRYYVGYGSALSPSTDSKALTLVDGSRTSVIPLEPERWMDRLCALAGRELTKKERKLAVDPDQVEDVCPKV